MNMRAVTGLVAMALMAIAPLAGVAQPASTLTALQGLAPVSRLPNTAAGRAALAANYAVTGAIQTGSLKQPTLLPFAEQQQLALRDAFITGFNAAELADALGSTLGAAYQAKAQYDGPNHYTNISPGMAALIAYAAETTGADSNSGKYFFSNETTNGKKPVSAEAAAILAGDNGVADVFGLAYGRTAGSPGADPYGNSRPFQTEPSLLSIAGPDYFGTPSDSMAYLRGPAQDLTESPSYPSGHTTYGTTESLLLAILVPERYLQAVTRAAEYGNNRIIIGAHYAMDVIGGRTLAMYDLAQLLANNPNYVGQPKRSAAVITDFQAALQTARSEISAALQSGCGNTIEICAAEDTSRFRDSAANEAFFQSTLTYGLGIVYEHTANTIENVGTIAPEAGYLLTAAFPFLTLARADDILTATEGPGGGFLDDGSAFGLYSRLDLYAAGKKAASLAK